jgi:hypothetical protein
MTITRPNLLAALMSKGELLSVRRHCKLLVVEKRTKDDQLDVGVGAERGARGDPAERRIPA